ncbi:MAG TPA: polysaccharide biosynthesis tyrosine autokinase [Pseudomonas sp.]|nr:polysaccharide biosynthesis tyrosine autokinase [Pseudomonas sp.]
MNTLPPYDVPRLPSSGTDDEDTLDLMRLWNILWRAKWMIAGLILAAGVLALLALQWVTPQYKATATLVIAERNPQVMAFQQLYEPTSEYLQTQLGLLHSRALAERVVKQLELTQHPLFAPQEPSEPWIDWRAWLPDWLMPEATEQPDDAAQVRGVVRALTPTISAHYVGKSQLIAVNVELPDPQLAANAANALAEGFIASQLDSNMTRSLSAADWMNKRLLELQENLRTAENRLQAYREAEGLVDLDGVSTISANELTLTGSKMIDARRERAEAQSQYRQVQALDGDLERLASVPAVLGHPLIQQFKADRARAQAKVDELSRRYGPKHPAMIAANTELNAATASLRVQVQQVVAGIERNYQLADANERSLRDSFNTNKTQIQDISRKEFRLRELQREVDSNRVLYETFLARLKETAATSDINSANAQVVDRAIVPIQPSKPQKGMILGIAALVAGVLGMGLAFVREALDDTFRTGEDVESRINVPLLGVVPLVTRKSRNRMAHLFRLNEETRFCESIRTLRTGLVLSDIDRPRQIVLVTSTLANEGKSTVAVNLAFSMSHIERVLLIEADLRNPTLAHNFTLPTKGPGLADLIAGHSRLEDCVRTVGKLAMLPAGTVPSNPQELLSSPRLAKILQALKSRYQRIIIDSPPSQVVSDALLLAKLSNALIYVIHAESTPIPMVQKGIGRLLRGKAPVIGVVLNQYDLAKAGRYGPYESYGYLSAPLSQASRS